LIEVSLRRVQTPEELGERGCDLCARPFRAQSVVIVADGVAGEWGSLATICPACLAYLAAANPERFPSVRQYEQG
jgi:hypothetical protein